MRQIEPVDELLVERATQGLSSAGRARLDALLASRPQGDHDRFDIAAAALDLALSGPEPELPAALRERLHQLARQYQGTASPPAREPLRLVDAVQSPARQPLPLDDRLSARRQRSTAGFGWWAAAAALLLALAGWWPRLATRGAPTDDAEGRVTTATSVAAGAETIRWAWQPTESGEARGASGAVVWRELGQTGFMEIRGLAPNDPEVAQYQLWIFDRTRDERYPVDGGVFDIPVGAGEVVIPIEAKIEVGAPYLFAVTLEKPGGVVVSDRERIVLLAQA